MINDLIIIGAGPAGLSAAIYAGRAHLSTVLIEKAVDGGQIATTAEIENYPGGAAESESGAELALRMANQAARFEIERVHDNAQAVTLSGMEKAVVTAGGDTIKSKAIIIATGTSPRAIGCENEHMFIGKGISFCATCDAFFFKNKDVFVSGGGDAAVEEALFLTKFARKVTVIHRRDELRAAKSLQEKAFDNDKINFIWDSVIDSVSGDSVLKQITIRNVKSNGQTVLKADDPNDKIGLFVFQGSLPNTALFTDMLTLADGYVITNENMETEIKGVFAAGDVRQKSLRQVVTAAADGAIAAVQAEKYIASL